MDWDGKNSHPPNKHFQNSPEMFGSFVPLQPVSSVRLLKLDARNPCQWCEPVWAKNCAQQFSLMAQPVKYWYFYGLVKWCWMALTKLLFFINKLEKLGLLLFYYLILKANIHDWLLCSSEKSGDSFVSGLLQSQILRRVNIFILNCPYLTGQIDFVHHSCPLNPKIRLYENKLLISNLVKKIDSYSNIALCLFFPPLLLPFKDNLHHFYLAMNLQHRTQN